MADTSNKLSVETLAGWIKFLLPLAIGAIGVYVGQIIAPMDSRLKAVEGKIEIISEHVHTDGALMIEHNRRLSSTEQELKKHKDYDHSTYATKDQIDLIRSTLRDDMKDVRDYLRAIDPKLRYNTNSNSNSN